jgi:hypothetical protein
MTRESEFLISLSGQIGGMHSQFDYGSASGGTFGCYQLHELPENSSPPPRLRHHGVLNCQDLDLSMDGRAIRQESKHHADGMAIGNGDEDHGTLM